MEFHTYHHLQTGWNQLGLPWAYLLQRPLQVGSISMFQSFQLSWTRVFGASQVGTSKKLSGHADPSLWRWLRLRIQSSTFHYLLLSKHTIIQIQTPSGHQLYIIMHIRSELKFSSAYALVTLETGEGRDLLGRSIARIGLNALISPSPQLQLWRMAELLLLTVDAVEPQTSKVLSRCFQHQFHRFKENSWPWVGKRRNDILQSGRFPLDIFPGHS